MSLLLFVAGLHQAASRPSAYEPAWTVTSSVGTHHMYIVNVRAQPGADLTKIGRAIVSPVIGQFDEVLIYVRTGSAVRRIQWTPQHGYAVLVISD